jgi:hypothetical protein
MADSLLTFRSLQVDKVLPAAAAAAAAAGQPSSQVNE